MRAVYCCEQPSFHTIFISDYSQMQGAGKKEDAGKPRTILVNQTQTTKFKSNVVTWVLQL